MTDSTYIGIDCGATKVMVQSAIFDSKSGLVSPGDFHLEINYANHPHWNSNFIPVHLDIQRQEYAEGMINLTEPEMDQSDVIVETIKSVITDSILPISFSPVAERSRSKGENTRGVLKNIGLCFPGLKNDRGVVIMANGPRIPDLLERIPGIDSILNDSDCCVMGEWKSTIGKLQHCENSVYIGGGTGIADGIILNGTMIDFNKRDDVKRSWELLTPSGETVEACLSPKGMIDQWNLSNPRKVKTLDELTQMDDSESIYRIVTNAFSSLIQDRIQFFKANHAKIEKIVIGQRLGLFMVNSKLGTMIEAETDIPIQYSSDRRTAALGAAQKQACL